MMLSSFSPRVTPINVYSVLTFRVIKYYLSLTPAAGPSDTLPRVKVSDALFVKDFRLFLLEYITVKALHNTNSLCETCFSEMCIKFLSLFRMTSRIIRIFGDEFYFLNIAFKYFYDL